MDAIRCENCQTVWMSFIAKDLMQLSGKCLRCDSEHINPVKDSAPASAMQPLPTSPLYAAQAV